MTLPVRAPDWIREKRIRLADLHAVKSVMRARSLHTVCEEARCPNRGECFSRGTATFLLLGTVCTRACGFCDIATGRPLPPDPEEPERVAGAAREMGLKFVVVTSVDRDDLPDGGAAHFAKTIDALRRLEPAPGVEVLTPDFRGRFDSVRAVCDASPDVFNHNVETVPRLYPTVRRGASLERSLGVLAAAKILRPDLTTKSGFMLGLGETESEIRDLLARLAAARVDVVTIGQYLRPSRENLPVREYVPPEVFERHREAGEALGFRHVFAGPFVRSSYRAEEGLAACGRLLMLDKRGTGLSDRVREVQSAETAMDDLRAVMDAVESERALLWSGGNATGVAVLFAATYPDRCAGLILFDPRVKGTCATDYPWAPTEEEWRRQLAALRTGWGERDFLTSLAREWAPEVADDAGFLDWFVWHMRRSLSPGAAVTAFRTAMELDVSDVLSAVRVPTLILPRPSLPGPAHYAAERIRGATVVELPELQGLYTWADDEAHRAAMEATAEFVARLVERSDVERVLATVLFTDIVGSTELAERLGDSGWRALLERHHATVRRELSRFQGRELDTAGDGFFAAFDGPARAVRAAIAIRESLEALDLEIRAGVHTGECEVSDGKIVGVAVSVGARIASLAGPGEVLVSSTVKDLVAGSGLRFDDRGEHQLKGLADPWRVFAAA